MIQTEIYRWTGSHTGRRLAGDWISKWWWAFAIPVCVLCFLGLSDYRWFIALMALVLVAYPGVLAIVYYSVALSPETVRSILPQRAQFYDEHLSIVYEPIKNEDGEVVSTPQPLTIPYSDITQFADNGSSLTITTARFSIEIPFSSFPLNSDARSALALLIEGVHCRKASM